MRENYLAIIKTVGITFLFFCLGAIIGVMFIPPAVRSMLSMAFMILVLFSLFASREHWISTKKRIYSYGVILGVLTGSSYIYYFNHLGAELFFSCVLGVLLIFGLAYAAALRLKDEKLYSLSPLIWAGIMGLFILEIINIFFFKFGTFDLLLSAAGILIYGAFSLTMMKSIQEQCRWGRLSEAQIVHLSYSVFISFLNLLLDLLRLLSILKREE